MSIAKIRGKGDFAAEIRFDPEEQFLPEISRDSIGRMYFIFESKWFIQFFESLIGDSKRRSV